MADPEWGGGAGGAPYFRQTDIDNLVISVDGRLRCLITYYDLALSQILDLSLKYFVVEELKWNRYDIGLHV